MFANDHNVDDHNVKMFTAKHRRLNQDICSCSHRSLNVSQLLFWKAES